MLSVNKSSFKYSSNGIAQARTVTLAQGMNTLKETQGQNLSPCLHITISI